MRGDTPQSEGAGGGRNRTGQLLCRPFPWHLTANGERYDRQAYTAAHRHLPFGTRVVVTRLDDGRTVTVRINDRGPFVRGRVIDLSHAAAAKLGMLRLGVVEVRVMRME